MQQNRVNQKPRHPNSSPVGPDVNDKKILRGNAVVSILM